MKREVVLAVWEQAHGRLHDNQRRAFLKKEYLKELLRFPDDVIVRAVQGNKKLSAAFFQAAEETNARRLQAKRASNLRRKPKPRKQRGGRRLPATCVHGMGEPAWCDMCQRKPKTPEASFEYTSVRKGHWPRSRKGTIS